MTRRRIATFGALAWLLPFACAESHDGPREEPPPAEASAGDASPADASPDERGSADAVVLSRCSGGAFCYVSLPVQAPIQGIAATRIDDAWAIGGSAILRWDGISWSHGYEYAGGASGLFAFDGIWVAKRDDVWALARDEMWRAFFVRYSSAGGGVPSFRDVSTEESLFSVAGAWVTPASDAFWALPGDSTVVRFREEGSGPLVVDHFTPQTGAEDERLYSWSSIWGFGPDDVFIGGLACTPQPPFPFCDYSVSPPRSAIAHYDGTGFSIALLGAGQNIRSMFGTPPGQPRHLWLTFTMADGEPTMTELVPALDHGLVGPPLHRASLSKFSGGVFGSASAGDAAWISNGRLLWRWTGSALEATATARNGVPAGILHGLWGGSAEDAWIVGSAVSHPDLPQAGFAARRSGGGGEP